jgi:hypothetical protein
MIAFLVAFSFACFSSQDKVVIIVLSITWFALSVLLLWWISVLYEGPSGISWYSSIRLAFKDSIKEWIMVRKSEGTNMHKADSDDTKMTS